MVVVVATVAVVLVAAIVVEAAHRAYWRDKDSDMQPPRAASSKHGFWIEVIEDSCANLDHMAHIMWVLYLSRAYFLFPRALRRVLWKNSLVIIWRLHCFHLRCLLTRCWSTCFHLHCLLIACFYHLCLHCPLKFLVF